MTDSSPDPSSNTVATLIQETEKTAVNQLAIGDVKSAKTLFDELLGLAPNNLIALNGLGSIAMMNSDWKHAEKHLRKASSLSKDWAEPHLNLGLAYLEQRRFRRSVKALTRAIELDSNLIEAMYRRAIGLQALGDTAGAMRDLRKVIELDPNHLGASNDLGCLEVQVGNLDIALSLMEIAASDGDAPPDHLRNYANALLLNNETTQARAEFERLLRLDSNDDGALIGIATCDRADGELETALENVERALSISPESDVAHNLAGTVTRELGDFDRARDHLEKALAVNPNQAAARSNLGMLNLLSGNWEDGWRDFEARRFDAGYKFQWDGANLPDWDGSDVVDKSIIVLSEQGFGDTIQFARFLPELGKRGANVYAAVQPELRRLFAGLPGVSGIVDGEMALPPLDARVLMMSLSGLLGITSQERVNGGAYLNARPPSHELAALLDDHPGLRVGVNWAGRADHKEDFKRTILAPEFSPILETSGVQFFNLAIANENATAIDGLVDPSPFITDFSDTASLISNLDLVISVDTSTVHLAGAIGTPCWAMIPFVPDWRWGLSGNTSAWYDSVKLYRQSERGNWSSVVDTICTDLSTLTER